MTCIIDIYIFFFSYAIECFLVFLFQKENKGVEEPFFYLANEWHKMYLEKTETFKTIS